MRCEREGNTRSVMEPTKLSVQGPVGTQHERERRTFVLHEPANFPPSPEIPDLDDLVLAPRHEPFTTLRRRSDGLDVRDVGGKNKDRLQSPFEIRGRGRRKRHGPLKAIKEPLVRAGNNFEGGWK